MYIWCREIDTFYLGVFAETTLQLEWETVKKSYSLFRYAAIYTVSFLLLKQEELNKLLKANTPSKRNLNPWPCVPVSCENSVNSVTFSHRRKLSLLAQLGASFGLCHQCISRLLSPHFRVIQSWLIMWVHRGGMKEWMKKKGPKCRRHKRDNEKQTKTAKVFSCNFMSATNK